MNIFGLEEINKCPYCKEVIKGSRGLFSNHVRWCSKNPERDSIDKQFRVKRAETVARKRKERKDRLKSFKVICTHCGKEFEVREPEKLFPLKEKYYCSRKCANSRTFTEESNRKRRETLFATYKKSGKKQKTSSLPVEHVCKVCGKVFYNHKVESDGCCLSHIKILKYYRRLFLKSLTMSEIEKEKLAFRVYRKECQFKFSLKDFPKEFDFELLQRQGIYKAKNRGDNIQGVSRDHQFSVKEGFRQKVDPYFISHPANCQLLIQTENESKGSRCIFSLEELKKRVKEWNGKYGNYINKINYNFLKKLGTQ